MSPIITPACISWNTLDKQRVFRPQNFLLFALKLGIVEHSR